MKFLFNATTLRKGGPVQRAVSFLREVRKNDHGHQWSFAISDLVADELRRFEPVDWGQLQEFSDSPARNKPARKQVEELELNVSPDAVFTIAGPAYVRFRSPHLLGCADGWITHSTWQAYRTLAFPREWLDIGLTTLYKFLWFRRADHWVVQTETAKKGLHRRLRIPLDEVDVLPNTCAEVYRNAARDGMVDQLSEPVRILCFSARYKHKRLDLLPAIAAALVVQEPTLDFQFVMTLPEECDVLNQVMQDANRLGVQNRIHNNGPVDMADGPSLYESCDLCFLPTVLETFSATYPEAMAMGLPIVTSDLNFARSVCQDAAIYFRPGDGRDAAQAIVRVIRDPTLRNELRRKGSRVLAHLPTPEVQCSRYVEILERMSR